MLEQVAHFTIVSKLGQGGMGVVFKAQDTKLRRQVALKLLPPEHVGDAERRARFLREAQAAAAVTHPHIATIYEVGEDADGRVFIAMELVAGKTLREVLASKRRLDATEAIRITRQIARGLAKAHEVGLIHRDLKPDNVMLSSEGDVKILDFGLAKARAQANGSMLEVAVTGALDVAAITEAGVIIGTPGYMSPEQATGKPVDERSDVFSLGVVLYEMLSGELPFRGTTLGELLVAVARDEPRPLTENLEVPAELAAFTMQCLAKDPETRPSNGRELVEAIDAVTAPGSSVAFARTERTPVSDPPPAPGRPDVAVARTERIRVSDPPPAPPRRFSARRIMLGLACAVAATVGIAFAVKRPSGPLGRVDAGLDAAVGLLALPPVACNEAAVREYRTALEVSRGRGMEFGRSFFERAIAADPSCAEAHLRAALYSEWGSAAHEHYNRASILREKLTERDRSLLDTYEPFFAHEPPDYDKVYSRLLALSQSRPNDAEILVLMGYFLWAIDPHDQLASYAQRVIDVDRGFSAGWHLLGTARQRNGDDEGAKSAFDECARTIPSSTECLLGQLQLAQWVGRCKDMEEHTRSLLTRSNDKDDKGAYLFLAQALASTGGGREVVGEALRQYASSKAAFVGKMYEAKLAVLFGDFDAAEPLLVDAERALDGSQQRSNHASRAQTAFELYLETGRIDAALKASESFVSRQKAWTGAVDEFFGSDQEGMLLVSRMLGLQHRNGKITREKRDREVERWYEDSVTLKEPRMHWLVTRAAWVETAEEAKLAAAAAPVQDPAFRVAPLRSFPNAVAAHVLALGGRDEGIDGLRKVTRRCDVLDAPLAHTQAHLWLGEALAKKGVIAEACAAYAVVLERWGGARRQSRSATTAWERAKALGCAVREGDDAGVALTARS